MYVCVCTCVFLCLSVSQQLVCLPGWRMVGLSIYLGTDTERDVRNLCLVHRKRIGLIACAQSRAGFRSRMKDSARSYHVRSIGGTFVRLRFPAKRQFTEALGSTHTRQFLRKFEDAKTHAIPIA